MKFCVINDFFIAELIVAIERNVRWVFPFFCNLFGSSTTTETRRKFIWMTYISIRTERFCVDERNWPKYREKLCELWLITTNISVRQFNLYSMFIVLIDWLIKKTTILWSVIVWNVWMIRIVIAREPIRVNANVTRSGGK